MEREAEQRRDHLRQREKACQKHLPCYSHNAERAAALFIRIFDALQSLSLSGQAKVENEVLAFLKDVGNTPLKKEAANWKNFLHKLFNIPQNLCWPLLFLCLAYERSLVNDWNGQFAFQPGETPQQPSFANALHTFHPQMEYIAKVMTCYTVTWVLTLSLQPLVLNVLSLLVLICATLFSLPEMVHKGLGSGVDVACGPFNLPLIWFATLGGLCLSLVCISGTLRVAYYNWRRRTLKGRPGDEESMDVDPETLKDEVAVDIE